MLLSWLSPRIARSALYAAVIAITILALIPAQEVPASTGWDKTDHWLGFFTLSLLAAHAYPRLSFWPRLVPLLIAYGIAIEIAQWFTPDRQADWHDVVADSIGVFAYGLVVWLVLRLRQPRVSEPG